MVNQRWLMIEFLQQRNKAMTLLEKVVMMFPTLIEDHYIDVNHLELDFKSQQELEVIMDNVLRQIH